MKTESRTFFEKIKLFFYPIKENKIIFYKWYFVSFLWWANSVVHVLFLERLTFYLENLNKDSFMLVLFYYISYILLYGILIFSTRKWWWVEIFWATWSTITNRYLKDFVELDNNVTELEWTGKLISIILNWIKIWWLILWSVIETWMRLFISILLAFFMVTRVNFVYGSIFMILFLLFLNISKYFTGKMNPYRKKRTNNMNMIHRYFTKVLMNKMEILHTNKISSELSNLTNLFKNDSRINIEMSNYRTFMNRSADFIIGIFFVISYYVLWKSYFNQEIWLNIIVWFWWALILMQKSISEVVSFYNQFNKDFVVVERLWEFFDETPMITWYDVWKIFEHKSWKINLKNITFSYDKKNKIFDDFSLKIPWEKITAMVWASGWWKSTLVKLVAWYIKADSWEVVIDWQKLSELSLKSYYKEIWYLTQEPSVFDWTVLENLTYAVSTSSQPSPSKEKGQEQVSSVVWTENNLIDDEKIKKVIKLAKCEFIYDLPEWINTEIWERWVRLSWWQRQRLAIAKIFLKNPKIIILDEPTSALDSFSEELITKAMHNLFKWRTVIIIAHRLQTVKHADKIFVIEWGTVVEEWDHKELVKKKGIYKRMLDLQSGF